MNITFTGHGIEVTEALKTLTLKKLEHVKNHFDHMTSIHVTLEVQNRSHIAKATIHVPGNDIYAHATEDDMYKSIDSLSAKLIQQITKYKEKLNGHEE
jgi:putative sigma-54 modulation protein